MDEAVSNSVFEFDLRHYSKVLRRLVGLQGKALGCEAGA
jgi:hypothetical protein